MFTNTLNFNIECTTQEQKFCDAIYEAIAHEKDNGVSGYYVLPSTQDALVNQIYEFIDSISNMDLKNVVVLGIGGSSLGAKAVDMMLSYLAHRKKINLIFLENCDPIFLEFSLKGVELKETLFLMISKSGSTIETTSLAKYVLDRFNMPLGSQACKEHFVVITDKGSPLDKMAEVHDIKRFNLPNNVGGRFSVLSAVGLVPLALVGYDIKRLLQGAKNSETRFFSKNYTNIMKKAFFYAKHYATYKMNVLFSYSSLLYHFNAWYVQLWGESLGKIDIRGNRVGLTPIGLVGSVDQHSFLQLIVEGPQDKTVTFIKIKDFGLDTKIPDISLPNLESTNYINGKNLATLLNAQCDATMETLTERGVPTDLIELERLNEESVGELLYYFELLTSCVGAFLGVNTYDQPGVEFGKKRLVSKFS